MDALTPSEMGTPFAARQKDAENQASRPHPTCKLKQDLHLGMVVHTAAGSLMRGVGMRHGIHVERQQSLITRIVNALVLRGK